MLTLNLHYLSASHYVAHLDRHASKEALLIRLPQEVAVQKGEKVDLVISFTSGDPGGRLAAEVAMATPDGGAVVKLDDPLDGMVLAGGAAAAKQPGPPHVSVVQDTAPAEATEPAPEPEPEEPERELTALEKIGKRKTGPLSWSADKLQAEWASISMADRVRVARQGDRSARSLVLRQQDKTLHAVLLNNSKLTPNELALMVGKSSLDPALLKRIASSREWTSRKAVARALICNPRLPLPQAIRLLRGLNENDLQQLTRSGNLRSAVRQEVGKHLAQVKARRRGKR